MQPVEDLTVRRPGSLARAQARRIAEEAPVRTALARLMRAHTDERAWRLGAEGEELVGAELARLVAKRPDWQALHSIPVGRSGADIDHVVVGPGGVFTINAKHHPGGRIWVAGDGLRVNGRAYPYVRNSRYEAVRAGRLLTAVCGFPVAVTGIVVPVNAKDVVIARAPDDVHVVTRRQLRRWLSRRQPSLDGDAVAAISDAARRPGTWTACRLGKRPASAAAVGPSTPR